MADLSWGQPTLRRCTSTLRSTATEDGRHGRRTRLRTKSCCFGAARRAIPARLGHYLRPIRVCIQKSSGSRLARLGSPGLGSKIVIRNGNDPGRIADGEVPWRDRFGHHRSRAHDRTVANRNAFQYDRARADEDTPPDSDRSRSFLATISRMSPNRRP
jgi:hypothetical protein